MGKTELLISALRKCSSNPHIISRYSHLKPKVNYQPYSEIPAARRLPLFGTTLDIIAAGSAPKLHKFYDARHHQLGPIFREPLGPIEGVFLSCPKMMRSLFAFEGKHPVHPLPEAWMIYNKKHGCQRGLLFMDGDEWFNNRRFMNHLLLNGDDDQLRRLTAMGTQKIIDKWRGFCKRTEGNYEIHELEETLYRWSFDVILFIMFGEMYKNVSESLDADIENFVKHNRRIFEDSSKLMTFPVKIAKLLNLDSWRNFENSVSNVLRLGNEVIDRSMIEFQDGNGMLSTMLKSNMSLDIVKRIVLDLIVAAGDTTTFATIWALYSLATNQDAQSNARFEILNNLDNEHGCARRIIRETLRLYPVAPFIGRFIAKDAIIGGYEIPKGTLVLLSMYTSGRDELNFVDANKFDPNRWKRNEDGVLCGVHQAHGTMPFALGSRSCVGRKIAMFQMQSLLESVISNFTIQCLNEKAVDIILRLVAVPDAKLKLAIKPI